MIASADIASRARWPGTLFLSPQASGAGPAARHPMLRAGLADDGPGPPRRSSGSDRLDRDGAEFELGYLAIRVECLVRQQIRRGLVIAKGKKDLPDLQAMRRRHLIQP